MGGGTGIAFRIPGGIDIATILFSGMCVAVTGGTGITFFTMFEVLVSTGGGTGIALFFRILHIRGGIVIAAAHIQLMNAGNNLRFLNIYNPEFLHGRSQRR
jgi:hypothetical protein